MDLRIGLGSRPTDAMGVHDPLPVKYGGRAVDVAGKTGEEPSLVKVAGETTIVDIKLDGMPRRSCVSHRGPYRFRGALLYPRSTAGAGWDACPAK
jgi:hypothetical protein